MPYILTLCTMIGFVYFSMITAFEYRHFLNDTSEFCKSNQGMFEKKDAQIDKGEYCWGWPAVEESVLAQVLLGNQKQITCIIMGNRDEITWEPFKPDDKSAYQELSKYGIHVKID